MELLADVLFLVRLGTKRSSIDDDDDDDEGRYRCYMKVEGVGK